MKSEIIEQLGQVDLLLPSLIAEGLAANDRVKVRLSILQAAARRARDPKSARFDMARECRDTGLDHVVLEKNLVNSCENGSVTKSSVLSWEICVRTGNDMEAMLRWPKSVTVTWRTCRPTLAATELRRARVFGTLSR